jgi:NitT/TauT family transport system permease protein
MTETRNDTECWIEAVSLPLLVLVWYVLAEVVDHRLLPTPLAVVAEMWKLATERDLIADLVKTLTRASWAFVAAMSLGVLLGALLGRFWMLDRLFASWVLIGLNVPAIVVAIACYIWLGLSEFALILAVTINKTPLVTVTMREGDRKSVV